jgi:hypothetical protein
LLDNIRLGWKGLRVTNTLVLKSSKYTQVNLNSRGSLLALAANIRVGWK